jgi:hypothetical protein
MGNGLRRRLLELGSVAVVSVGATLALQSPSPGPPVVPVDGYTVQVNGPALLESIERAKACGLDLDRCQVLLAASEQSCADQLGHCEAACAIK